MNRVLQAVLSFELSVLSLFLCTLPLSADLIHLSNGNTVEGIVLSSATGRIEVQFAAGGSITFHPEEIESIERSDPDRNRDIKTQWAQDDKQFQADLKAKKEYEDAQRAQGLIKFEGEWLTKEEVDARLEQDKLEVEQQRIESERAAAKDYAAAAQASQAPPKQDPAALNYGTIVGTSIVSFPFWDARGKPVYKTFPSQTEVFLRSQHQHHNPHVGLDLYQQATGRTFNHYATTPKGALSP